MDLNYSSRDHGRYLRVSLHMGLKTPRKDHIDVILCLLQSPLKAIVRKMVRNEKIQKIFFRFSIFDLDLVWYRLLYGKASTRTSLKGLKHHMTIFFDLRSLWLSEGSTSHFWPKSRFQQLFFQISKIVSGVDQVAI